MTHSNHPSTHLDGEIHFFTTGKVGAIAHADLELNDFLGGLPAIIDLSDATGDYQNYRPSASFRRGSSTVNRASAAPWRCWKTTSTKR